MKIRQAFVSFDFMRSTARKNQILAGRQMHRKIPFFGKIRFLQAKQNPQKNPIFRKNQIFCKTQMQN